MQNLFENYIQSISAKFSHVETSEMGYRSDFETLLKEIFESLKLSRIDHDAKATEGNKPDFIVLNHDIPILYIEAKTIGISLDKVEKSEQMARYYGYANLVLTDYVEFRFYRNGLRYEEPIKIANYDIKNRIITAIPENYEHVAKTLVDFTQSHKEPIKSGKHLSKIMGGKAQRIRDNVRQFLATESEKNTELVRVYETIKKLLVHDLTLDAFADMYAQTLVYGLFVARYHDDSPGNFTRREARELVPASNPLLRHFFDHIVGPDFDKRLEYIVNELCEVFSHADVHELMREYFKNDLFGKTHEGPDPVIHFYEDFLKEYDAELRKKLGAFYTPLPVVRFIVRSVDYLLQKEFGLSQGLADTSKIGEAHRVQILDLAVGTGTFLTEVVRNIYSRFKGSQIGRWPKYVLHDLLPRLYGFELMMAPYTIAHLKLSMILKETGFKYFNDTRLGIYLTNSLEESVTQEGLFSGFGFAESIAEESKEAEVIKNKKPIMVVIGNPPYSGVSSNETKYANSLVEKYKIEPGGKQKLQERKHWLNDDYVKFIALAENMVIKNREGVIGMITAHGYIDNPTFRGMRWHLRNVFDVIYVIDLHGNSNKKEISPDGSKDENVFDIKTGVSIILAVKKSTIVKDKKLAQIYQADFWGTRKIKFTRLDVENLESIHWNIILENTDLWKLEGEGKNDYQEGFSMAELFPISNTGVCSQRDEVAINESIEEMKEVLRDFLYLPESEIRNKYKLKKDGRDWTVKTAKEDVTNFDANPELIKKIDYRPFDTRYTFFTRRSRGFVAYPRGDVFKHLERDNISILINKAVKNKTGFHHIFVSKNLPDLHLFETANASIYASPLYLYAEDGSKVPNLKKEIVDKIENVAGKVSPEDIFDYIYAALHSPSYREKYKEFLKIDFPRVPYPTGEKSFKRLVALGGELRALHLLESPKVNKFITTYPVAGSDAVEKISYQDGKVFINKDQHFGNVPEVAWSFYIGGYQPAQKWLKDRKGRTLTNNDIEHYQKIIVALIETGRIMKEIDG